MWVALSGGLTKRQLVNAALAFVHCRFGCHRRSDCSNLYVIVAEKSSVFGAQREKYGLTTGWGNQEHTYAVAGAATVGGIIYILQLTD